MVAIEHRSTSATTSTSILSPTSNTSATSASTSAASTSLSTLSTATANTHKKMSSTSDSVSASKSAVSQRDVEVKVSKKKGSTTANATNKDATALELSKKVLKLDLTGKEVEEYSSLKSPKSPIVGSLIPTKFLMPKDNHLWFSKKGRLPHQTSLNSSVDVEDRKTLREALYQGIFHRHRRTIFAVGSFLRMLRSRNSQYNTIRSSSEGEDIDEVVR
ncbi:platelet binding protein GspB isoform X1 [Lucilia sericata]|uniref:platelet binding protein GspB isoform X1 n=1 Tax=Lucilia sericata TaxID=13632 RepID=UPI0018A85441|nr:platelet binding protein GspB isoform X1 [Lucilia sericata]